MSAHKHKSSQDFKTARIANAVKKLGGKEQADQIFCTVVALQTDSAAN